MRVLVTGGSGFVGQAMIETMGASGQFDIVAALRRPVELSGTKVVPVGEIGLDTDWRVALDGVETIVHCAGLAHRSGGDSASLLAAFRSVNKDGTLRLAEQAAAAGAKRLVFLSSVKVHGEATYDQPFRETDAMTPLDAYGVSKREAELGLREVSQRTGMEIVIIRPPLVYGPNPKANMLRLMQWVSHGIPLPFAAIANSRSLVSLQNLISAVMTCLVHPGAAGRHYLVSDQFDVSTPELIRSIAQALGRPAGLWPLPLGVLVLGGRLVGRSDEIQRLVGSLVVDSRPISQELGWRPPQTLQEGVAEMVAAYVSSRR